MHLLAANWPGTTLDPEKGISRALSYALRFLKSLITVCIYSSFRLNQWKRINGQSPVFLHYKSMSYKDTQLVLVRQQTGIAEISSHLALVYSYYTWTVQGQLNETNNSASFRFLPTVGMWGRWRFTCCSRSASTASTTAPACNWRSGLG